MTMTDGAPHVVVVGAGCAGLCAAIAAAEAGARVTVLERGTGALRGGDTAFSVGSMLFTYAGVEQLLELLPDLPAEDRDRTDFGTYPAARFFDDMARVTEHRADPDLVEQLVTRSFDTMRWLTAAGVAFAPLYGSLAVEVEGRMRFLGGLTLAAKGGGAGLVEALRAAAVRRGVDIRDGARVVALRTDAAGGVRGVAVRAPQQDATVTADAVILAAGGFQASAQWRAEHLGPGWDLAKVRGTPLNTGDGIRMALDAGAMSFGNWSGCHAVTWDLRAPDAREPGAGGGFQKLSYPYGIMVNARGERFVDEGADLGNYTYARYGRVILEQPGQYAWQVFDAKVAHLLRDEYRGPASRVTADSLEELAANMAGVDAETLLRTISEFNAAISDDVAFAPERKDGRRANLPLPKSNWATTIDQPPFSAYPVTCGITFTFGGLRIDPSGRVLDTEQRPVPGLYACGELVGGLFYGGYPGGSGLTAAAVFGRLAGATAAAAT